MNKANKHEVKNVGININEVYAKCWNTVNNCASDTFNTFTASDRRAISEQTLFMIDIIIKLSKRFISKKRSQGFE